MVRARSQRAWMGTAITLYLFSRVAFHVLIQEGHDMVLHSVVVAEIDHRTGWPDLQVSPARR